MPEYIKKEAVIKFIENGLNNPDKTKSFGHDAIEIMAEVQYIPAADVVEVRHGEWVQIGYDEALDRITCSCCKEYFNLIDNCTEAFNYCPNCGAKMDGATNTNVGGKMKEGAEE